MPNYDEKTGIHYGVISQNSLAMDHMDRWYDNDATYDNVKQEIIEGIKGTLSDQLSDDDIQEVVDLAIDKLNESWQNDEPHFYYEDSEYSAEYSQSLNCWIILKSPYYTFCQCCSPCVPDAGDCDRPVTKQFFDNEENYHHQWDHPVKAYCLPKKFFDSQYCKIPYRYYRVSDDSEVIAPIVEVD